MGKHHGSHSAGIDSLPATRAYNDALSNARYGSDRATRTIEEARAMSRNIEDLRMKAMREKSGPTNLSKTLDRQMNKEVNKAINSKRGGQATSVDQIERAAEQGKVLWADQDSDCFAGVSWQSGVCTLLFYRGGQVEYSLPMELDEFLDFANSDSLGGYFNDNLRDDTHASK